MNLQKYKIDIILELVFITLDPFLQIIINVYRLILMTDIFKFQIIISYKPINIELLSLEQKVE